MIQPDGSNAAGRDDAHQAAWQPHGVGGPTWEALTSIRRGEAYSPDSPAKLLERRAQPPGARGIDRLSIGACLE